VSKRKLLVTVDSLRRDHQKYLENTSKYLEFEDRPVFSTAPSTYSSFQSILSGQYTSSGGVDSTVADEFDIPTIGISTNNFLTKQYGYNSGFDHFSSPKDNIMSNWKSRIGGLFSQGSRKHQAMIKLWSKFQSFQNIFSPNEVGRDFRKGESVIEEFKKRKAGKDSWFAWLHFMEPHHPYNPPNTDISRRKAKILSRKATSGSLEDDKTEIVQDLYKGEVIHFDKLLTRLWDCLSSDTEVIFCSDHGEYIGNNGDWGHGMALEPQTTKVPLAYKNIDNKPTGDVISLIDIPSILLDRDYKEGCLDRNFAYGTFGDTKAVFSSYGYKNKNGSFNYSGDPIENDKLDEAYANFSKKEASRMTEGLEEDLQALGYLED
jgi:hypothetical protein